MFCPTCKVGMKPLFTSWYCPNDCDRPKVKSWVEKRAEKRAAATYFRAYKTLLAPPTPFTPDFVGPDTLGTGDLCAGCGDKIWVIWPTSKEGLCDNGHKWTWA